MKTSTRPMPSPNGTNYEQKFLRTIEFSRSELMSALAQDAKLKTVGDDEPAHMRGEPKPAVKSEPAHVFDAEEAATARAAITKHLRAKGMADADIKIALRMMNLLADDGELDEIDADEAARQLAMHGEARGPVADDMPHNARAPGGMGRRVHDVALDAAIRRVAPSWSAAYGDRPPPPRRLGMDEAAKNDLHERFPGLARIVVQ